MQSGHPDHLSTRQATAGAGEPGDPLSSSATLRRLGPLEFLVMLGFAVLLTLQLSQWPLNADEARYARSVSYSWTGMFHWIQADNYPPGYFVLYKLWTGTLGLGEQALRMFSVPFGFFGLLVFGTWAFRAFGWRIGRRTWIFLAVSPFFLLLDRMAKYYSLFLFLTVSSTSLMWWILERRKTWPAGKGKGSEDPSAIGPKGTGKLEVLWAAASLALLWVHYLGAVVWIAMGGWLLWRWARHRSRPARRLFILLCVTFVGFLPWMPVLVVRLLGGDEGTGVWSGTGEGSARLLVAKLGYTAYAFALGHTLEISHYVLAGMGCAAAWTEFLWGVGRTLRHRKRHHDTPQPVITTNSHLRPNSPEESCVPDGQPDSPGSFETERRARDAAGYCLYLVIVMGGATFLILSVFLGGLPVLAVSERLGFLLPYVVALAAFGVDHWNRWIRWATAVVYLIPVFFSLSNLYTAKETNVWDQRIPWDRVVQEVRNAPEQPTVVLFDNYHFGSLGWYYLRPVTGEFTEVFSKEGEPERPVESLAAGAAEAGRVFLVRSTRDVSPDEKVSSLEDALTARFGVPFSTLRLAFDSPGLRKLKERFRHGTGVETFPAKVTVREYCPSNP